ncbi:MAG: helix-turn-helix domain-containing protein [Desulfoplanes sp.]|nr:helix-turn-helix domain-containing protein [Desulfoplanes sp.]
MSKRPPSISVRRGLRKLGDDLRKARLRRRLKMTVVADRAGISRETLAKIQKGDPGVSMGNYAGVIFALGLGTQWMEFADIRNDPAGLALDEENLPKRARGLKL